MNERKLLHDRAAGHALVGAFVVVAALVFAGLLWIQGEDVERYQLIVEFNAIGNINEATLVRLRGFEIGQVERVEFRPQPPAGEAYFQVVLGIEMPYPVLAGTMAEIRSSGLVGDTYINLDPSQASGPPLAAGSRIRGREETGMKELVDSATEMAHRLGAAGESIRRADLGYKLGRLGDSMHRAASSLEQVAGSTDSLMRASRLVVERSGPGVERVLLGLESTLRQLEGTLRRTDTLVVASREDVAGSVRALRQAVERLEQVLGRVDSMVDRKEAQIDSTLDNLHTASEAVRQISEHPWKLITGQGKAEERATEPPARAE